jgi:hypothetical protein
VSTADKLALYTLIVTIAATLAAVIGLIIAIRTLRIGNQSLQVAVNETKATGEYIRAQNWIILRGIFVHYDTVASEFRPGGSWSDADKGPNTAREWTPVEAYMGLFEHMEFLLENELLNPALFDGSYLYRVDNILHNKVVVFEKLERHPQEWIRFLRLCRRFAIEIPCVDSRLHSIMLEVVASSDADFGPRGSKRS